MEYRIKRRADGIALIMERVSEKTSAISYEPSIMKGHVHLPCRFMTNCFSRANFETNKPTNQYILVHVFTGHCHFVMLPVVCNVMDN